MTNREEWSLKHKAAEFSKTTGRPLTNYHHRKKTQLEEINLMYYHQYMAFLSHFKQRGAISFTDGLTFGLQSVCYEASWKFPAQGRPTALATGAIQDHPATKTLPHTPTASILLIILDVKIQKL